MKPTRADAFGVLCAFVVTYCVLEGTWEPLASLALVLAAFAVALPRMVGRFRVGGAPPTVEGEFERRLPPDPRRGPDLESAPEKGSDVG
jgi:hypothetical protein